MNSKIRILATSICVALSPFATAHASDDIDRRVRAVDDAGAHHGQANVANKIASQFVSLAGSKDNALALVNGLRNGTDVTLKTTVPATGTGTTPTTTTTTIDPPTGKMGWGNVRIALGLAQDALLRAGITKPTAAQLQAALDGGTVTRADGTTVTLKGVLQMRADGMGWGQIAQAGGTKVGPVVSSLKHTETELEKLPDAKHTGPTTKASTATASSGKGMTTAAGVTTSPGKSAGKGLTTATGVASPSSSKGLVSAEGAVSSHSGKGQALGRGVVTAAGGGGAVSVAATSRPAAGAGVVNAAGGSSGAVATASGNAGDNGKGHGNGNGKSKGG